MRTYRSLYLGLILAIAYTLCAAFFDCSLSPLYLFFPLLTLAALVIVYNPLCRRLSWFRPFNQLELIMVGSMTLVAASLVHTGIPLKMLGAMTALYHHQLATEKTDWNARIAHAFPDHLIISTPGTQELARELRDVRHEWQSLTRQLKVAEQRIQCEQHLLDQLREKLLQHEARAYGCNPQDIAQPRQDMDRLTRKLIQLTRKLNELRTNPDNAKQKTLEQAVALNQKLAGLTRERERTRRQIRHLEETLATITASPNPHEVPRLHAIRQDIQEQQKLIQEEQKTLTSLNTQAEHLQLTTESLHDCYRTCMKSTAPLTQAMHGSNPRPPTIRGWEDVKTMLRKVPWNIWLEPIMAWGIILIFTILIFHNLANVLVRQWTVLDDQHPDFPLARIISDTLPPEDDLHPGTNLFKQPAFAIGLLMGAGCLFPLTYAGLALQWDWSRLLPSTSPFLLFAHTFPLTFSLPLVALACILPRRVSGSFCATQAYLAAVIALTIPVFRHFFPAASLPPDAFRQAQTAFGLGATLVFGIVLLHGTRSLLFCCLHPYDIPKSKRVERRSLARSSATLIFSSIALVLSLNILLGLTFLNAILVLFLLLSISAVTMKLSAELGFAPYRGSLLPGEFAGVLPALPAMALYLNCLAAPCNNPLGMVLPHTLRLRQVARLGDSTYRLAIGAVITLVIILSACMGLAVTYSFSMPAQLHTGIMEAGQLFAELLNSSQQIPWISLALGGCIMLPFALLKQQRAWLPNPAALVLLPFLSHAWLSLLIGLLLTMFADRTSPNARDNLRFAAIGILCAALLVQLFFN